MKRIEITWRDSRIYGYQMSPDETFEFCTVTSVGYLIQQNKKQVVIARDRIDDDWRGIMVIPRENIKKIVGLH